jgi:PAS domain S-box-containing protein
LLDLDFLYARLRLDAHEAPIDALRTAPLHGTRAGQEELRNVFNRWSAENPQQWPAQVSVYVGAREISILPIRMGIEGELGLIVAGSQKPGLPEQTESLVLGVAANQLTIGLQQALRLNEQKRVTSELDRRVEERTRELAEMNEQLRESEQRFRLIVDGIAGLVAIMSPAGELEVVNHQALTYFGKTAEQLKGWSTSDAVHPDDLSAVISAWTRSVETASVYDIDHRLLRADGQYRWFHARGLPQCDAEGRILRWYVLLTDIHDRKQAEESLNTARAELAHVARITSLGALTASIAHEVNQPLSGIVMNASTCLRMLSGDEPNIEGARETARRTIRDGNRASEVVTRLRALFKRKEVAAEPIDLNEAAREVIALSLSELQSNRVMVRHDFAENLPAVKGDRIQIQQVILNLLRNASDAMRHVDERPRHLLIKTECDDGKNVLLAVEDSGIGFAADTADRLFESFYTTKEDGMGIGLSVSRSIIEAHRGRLWASANDGAGSSFKFSIPTD